VVQRSALAVAPHPGEIEDAGFPGGQQRLAGELGRRAQVEGRPPAIGADRLGGEGVQMSFGSRRHLQRRGLHLDEIARGEPGAHSGGDPVAGHQEGATGGVVFRPPPGGRRRIGERRAGRVGHGAQVGRATG
jgi:hypothetical protein